jgi:hypothetical protein
MEPVRPGAQFCPVATVQVGSGRLALFHPKCTGHNIITMVRCATFFATDRRPRTSIARAASVLEIMWYWSRGCRAAICAVPNRHHHLRRCGKSYVVPPLAALSKPRLVRVTCCVILMNTYRRRRTSIARRPPAVVVWSRCAPVLNSALLCSTHNCTTPPRRLPMSYVVSYSFV